MVFQSSEKSMKVERDFRIDTASITSLKMMFSRSSMSAIVRESLRQLEIALGENP